jgi:hypothetical protein
MYIWVIQKFKTYTLQQPKEIGCTYLNNSKKLQIILFDLNLKIKAHKWKQYLL